MRTYRKIALLALNDDRTKYLVVQKVPYSTTQEWIMPGGQLEEHSEEECLANEILEELDCEVGLETLKYIGTYEGPAAGNEDNRIWMKIYEGKLLGTPTPSGEIVAVHWVGEEDLDNPRLSRFNREVLMPDLLERGILRSAD